MELWYHKVKMAIKLQADLYAPMYAKIKNQTEGLQSLAGSAEMTTKHEYKRYAAPNGVTDTAYTDYADETNDNSADSAANRLLTLQNQLENIDEMFLQKMEPLFCMRL